MTLTWRALASHLFVAPIPNTDSQFEVGRYAINELARFPERWYVIRRDGVLGGPITMLKDNYASAASAKRYAGSL